MTRTVALPRKIDDPWRLPLLLLAVMMAALLLLYRQTAMDMAQIWSRNDTFAHGYLVVPLVLWLAWRRRRDVLAQTPRPMPLMLLPMAALAMLWALADLVSVNAVAQFAFVGMVIAAVPLVVGAAAARRIAFPLAFLLFAVPFGEFMLQPMMNWTANFVVAALRMSGIPVYREGLYFVIPSGNWSVIDECSGVRYLIASFMVGSLFAYLNYRSTLKRAVFMGFSLLMPILANWLRAYLIVMMGHLSDNKIATGVDHLLYGWIFFGVVIFVMFMICMRWADTEDEAPSPAEAGAVAGANGFGRAAMPVVAAAALLVGWPHAAIAALESRERDALVPVLDLPQSIGNWNQTDKPQVDWAPSWRNPRVEWHRGYRQGEQQVGVYVAYYRGQNPESKLVSSLNAVVGMNDRRWNAVGVRTMGASTSGIGPGLREYDILGPDSRLGGAASRPHVVARSFYWIDGRLYGSDAVAKLATAWSRLGGRLDDGAALVIYASGDSFDQARQLVQAFQTAALGTLGDRFEVTRRGR
jgi:exosortase A